MTTTTSPTKPKRPNRKDTTFMSFRLTSAQLVAMKAAAAAEGCSLSAWVRKVLDAALTPVTQELGAEDVRHTLLASGYSNGTAAPAFSNYACSCGRWTIVGYRREDAHDAWAEHLGGAQ